MRDPLQNRVTPSGEIVAVPQRGLFTGNRGIIHDPATKTLLRRRWTNPAWIVCVCEFRGRRRDVMGTRSWTELFFLDEATALAAGHRPCFYCRRADAEAFRAAWARGNGAQVSAKAIDAVLHRERLDGRTKRLHLLPCAIGDLPDGAMVQAKAPDTDGAEASRIQTNSYLIVQGRAWRWSFDGYHETDAPRDALLLTPPSTLRALGAGYAPVLHPSARATAG
ncbi:MULTISPECIES: hypothetical protein [Rhodopseudomonas]|uniref:Uncharacterized protein n=1 Tax=Rhodopseudomonas palustris TaxID=1076 RepID=A0A0D7F018_RHOPL|nr:MULTISPECIES: hypothetical protein [Rhodopseudomonas]KIZ45047.1 hypothetical protein OO17_08580 [Rhodopseudomonas palustris]MDF3810403.1 hypothetical protein [Rhodopseudomonas sp. BAL398]WOK19652.1 hypothetical protein RBJ75_09100 [Rhodopseudomonas sp. BAL398]